MSSLSTPAPPSATGAASDPRRWKALVLLALVQFMFALDGTIVNPALPTIQNDLGFSASGLAWVVNGYTLMAGGFLILGGRVADLFGRRRMFVAGTIVFAISSAVSGLAQNPATLIGARFGQGLGEALAAPAALSLVVLLFHDPKERAKAIGAWGGIAGLGATLGVVISGIIVNEISWRWIFLVNLPVAAIVVFILPRMVTESRMEGDRKIDFMGAVFVTGGLTLVVDGLLNASDHGWGSDNVLIPLLIGTALLIGFGLSQAASKAPLVPLRFFRNRTRITANLATVFAGAGFFTMFFTVTLYMQDVLHYSPLKAGLAWGPFGLMLFVGMAVSMPLLPRIGVKAALTASFVISGLGLYLLTSITPEAHYASHVLPGMLVMAFGQSISFIGLQNSALHKLGPADAGLGSAMSNTSQQLGGSLGLAILVTIALRHTTSRISDGVSPPVAATDGYVWALRLAAAAMIVGAIVVATLFEKVAFTPPDKQALEAAEASAGELSMSAAR
ncbi:DHA2 family efflux MFS transporter permease subunit [Streptacidiphilus sp. EB129]|uniref:DHA2 family efflux MFS transporter permease subunit n=1 Tax=Streptacidiphilus sp. EB129 TaxID=3156262 RepID=UPI003516E33A